MKPNSCEALPGNYRLSRTIDFVNMSRENVIGLLLTLVLLVVPVLLVLPSHPFSLMFSAQNAFFSLLYCAGAFLLMVLSMRLQAKLHGFCLFKTCDCPVEYVSMGSPRRRPDRPRRPASPRGGPFRHLSGAACCLPPPLSSRSSGFGFPS